MQVGTRVEVRLPDDSDLYECRWWPRRGVRITGTVQKVFRNGKVAVAVDQLRNRSEDGCGTMHFLRDRLYAI
jgi:hypothetical protein